MRIARALAVLVATTFALVVTVLGTGPACSATSCTPEEHGLETATRLTPRQLGTRAPSAGACVRTRLDVISSAEELEKLYAELGVVPDTGASTADAGMATPVVDFSRERVIVREGDARTISWAVAKDGKAFVGLLACNASNVGGTCRVDVIAIDAPVTAVEPRICESVGCGGPQAGAIRNL